MLKKRSFTLIEVVLALVLLGIIAAIALPRLLNVLGGQEEARTITLLGAARIDGRLVALNNNYTYTQGLSDGMTAQGWKTEVSLTSRESISVGPVGGSGKQAAYAALAPENKCIVVVDDLNSEDGRWAAYTEKPCTSESISQLDEYDFDALSIDPGKPTMIDSYLSDL